MHPVGELPEATLKSHDPLDRSARRAPPGIVKRSIVGLLLLLLVFSGWWVASGSASRFLVALRVLDDLRRPDGESWLDRSTAPPIESSLRLEGGPHRFEADLYRPAHGRSHVPVLFVPGAVELGRADPRVAPFARTLARAGFTVVVPDLPSFRTLKALPDNVRELALAHALVCARRDLAPLGRAGLLGVSYAGGIAMLVALESAQAAQLPYVVTVGAFADLDSAVRFLATGRMVDRGRVRQVQVDPYGRLVFVRTYEDFMRDPRDRALLEAILERRMANLSADISDLVERLGPEGRLVVDLFEGRDQARVPELMARLPMGLRRRMAELSPARRDFSRLGARLYLAHALDDGTFPISESERLAALARPHVRVRLVRLAELQHVVPEPWRKDPWGFITRDLPEAARLAGWWTALLAEC